MILCKNIKAVPLSFRIAGWMNASCRILTITPPTYEASYYVLEAVLYVCCLSLPTDSGFPEI